MRILPKRRNEAALANARRINSLVGRALLLAFALLPVILLWGCAGIVSGQNSSPASQNPQTYTISGTITPVTGGSGATVKLSGAASATATANTSGTFVFSGLANGTYTITPSQAGYTFTPTSLNVTISGASVTTGVSFTATAQSQTYSISGTVTPASAGSGATITLSGVATGTTTANASGAFTFSGLANGTYTLTPSHAGFTFSPPSVSVTISGANITSGVTFTGTPLTYSISGTISPTAGGSMATVSLSGAVSATTVANSSGAYSFSGLSNGSYAVTPTNTGYTYSPTTQAVTISGASVPNVNFTATAQTGQTYSISGTLSPIAGGSGATVVLSGAGTGTTLASSSGTYAFTGLSNGVYTVTPSNAGYTFSPANQSVTVSGSTVSNVNFSATALTYTVGLTWVASTSTVSGYNVYRSTANGGPYTLVNSLLISGLSYIDSTVQNGVLYYYVVTAVDSSGDESIDSNQVSAAIP